MAPIMLTDFRKVVPGMLIFVLSCAGCESASWMRSLHSSFAQQTEQERRAEESHRKRYRETHDRKSLHYLLAHRVQTGMSYKDVCKTLGEDGTREARDNWLKSKGAAYQLGDEVYAFGPDSEGQTVYLAFREDMLVNFDPLDFRSSAALE